jgi:hypothetical protein
MLDGISYMPPEEARPIVNEFFNECEGASGWHKLTEEDRFFPEITEAWEFVSDVGDSVLVTLNMAVQGFMCFVRDLVAGIIQDVKVTLKELKNAAILLGVGLVQVIFEYCMFGKRAADLPRSSHV